MTYLNDAVTEYLEDENKLNGLGNLLPYIDLIVGLPSDAQGTLYVRDQNGLVYYNKWGVGFAGTWRWYEGKGSNGWSLPIATGYYAWRKDSYAWQGLGTTWVEASNTLIKMGLAKPFVAKQISIADAVNQKVKEALKPKIKRTSNALLGANETSLNDLKNYSIYQM